ncbi:E3 ubiquitin-protein ligase TRIM33-like [Pomacea canaliculata]|uniref:E3 ubiquitin-protein ligase TRIM33-like n=1 Tax=Pomacea canaliculata TaxID=400727 RepID=UPI000D738CAB|nr:E3 ubiquitin-protein ligase TRIM33-like [Pomacea canaliculata]
MNFYLSEEKLENERRVKGHETCPVHDNEHVTLYCQECDQVMCIRCKVTTHDGHLSEDITSTLLRCKKQIENDLHYLDDCIQRTTQRAEMFQNNEKRAQEKREALAKQIQARYDKVVTMAGFLRDQALQKLEIREEREDRTDWKKNWLLIQDGYKTH